MKSNESTPSWVQPVDAATCAALSRELWGMLSAAGVDLSVVDFCDYITGATLAFQRVYVDAEWGVTHDWMEATERHLAGYLRDYPIRPLEAAWERQAGPLPVTSAVYDPFLDDEAIKYAERVDVLCDSAGKGLAVELKRAGIPCVDYGDGILVILWGFTSPELRVCISVEDDESLTADVCTFSADEMGDYEQADEMWSGPLGGVVAAVQGILSNVHAE